MPRVMTDDIYKEYAENAFYNAGIVVDTGLKKGLMNTAIPIDRSEIERDAATEPEEEYVPMMIRLKMNEWGHRMFHEEMAPWILAMYEEKKRLDSSDK
jgi:hypothetical protein